MWMETAQAVLNMRRMCKCVYTAPLTLDTVSSVESNKVGSAHDGRVHRCNDLGKA